MTEDRYFVHRESDTAKYTMLRYVVLHADGSREVMTDEGPFSPQECFSKEALERYVAGTEGWWREVSVNEAIETMKRGQAAKTSLQDAP